MTLFVTQVILGAAAGATIALLGVGIVLVYRATGILNFAHASVGMAAAYVNFELLERMPQITVAGALVIALATGALLGIAQHELVYRHLESTSQVTKLIVSIGVAGAIQGSVGWIFGHLGTPLVTGKSLLSVRTGIVVAGAAVPTQRLAIVVAGVGVGLAVWALVRFTSLGIQIRALAQNPSAARLAGVDDRRIRRVVWAVSGASAALVGVLQLPFGVVSVLSLNGFQLSSFAAALVGGFASLPAVVAGGLGLGIGREAIAALPSPLSGLAPALAPLTILVLLMIGIERYFVSDQEAAAVEGDARAIGAVRRPVVVGTARTWLLGSGGLVMITLALSGFWTFVATRTAVYALLGLSLVVLTGWAGQVSLMPGTFAGVGACLAWLLGTRLGFPFLITVPLAALATVPVSAVAGIAALRLRPLYLAVATVALAGLFEETLFVSGWFANGGANLTVARPGFVAGDHAYAAFVFVVGGAVFAASAALARSRTGRVLRMVRDNPTALASSGLNPVKYRLVAFALSAGIAGLAGALLAYLVGAFSTELFSLLILSLATFGVAAVGGLASPLGAVIGAFLFVWLTEIFRTSGGVSDLTTLGVGVGIVAVMALRPDGLVGFLSRRRGPDLETGPDGELDGSTAVDGASREEVTDVLV